MNKNLEKEYILPSNGKVIGSNLLDSLMMLTLVALTFFGVIRPIYNANIGNKLETNLVDAKRTLLQEGTSSHLIYHNEKTDAISTPESIYKVMIFQTIKTCYEVYPDIYKKDLDDVGYTTKTDFFKDVKLSTFESNDLGYFYTTYIPDKLDEEGNKILNVKDDNYREHFIKEVLDIEKEGKEFYDVNITNEGIPLFTKDTCRYLFQYHVMNLSYSTLRDVDYKFYKYFISRYEEAGQLLLKVPNYKNSFNDYQSLYTKKMSENIYLLLASYSISWLVIFIIAPYLLKPNRTLSQKIFKLQRLNQDKEFKKEVPLFESVLAFIKHFYVLFIIAIIADGLNLINFKFIRIGVLTINLMHLIVLSLILTFISMCIKFASKNKLSLGERLFKIELFEETIS